MLFHQSVFQSIWVVVVVGMFAIVADAKEVIFSGSINGGIGDFDAEGSVTIGDYGVRIHPGNDDIGRIVTKPIAVSGFSNLTLSYRRNVKGLDEGEMASVAYSVDGEHYIELEGLSNTRGKVILPLRDLPDSLETIQFRFEIKANSFFERYTIRDVQIKGDPEGSVDSGDQACMEEIDMDSPVLSNGFGSNSYNTGNVDSAINASNVHQLKLDYAFVSEDTDTKRGAPTVTDQAVFFYGLHTLHAIHRETGCEYWQYQSEIGFKSSSILLVPSDGMLFVGDKKGYVHAIDAKTGELVWKDFIGVDDSTVSAQGHVSTGGMQYHNGLLIVPVSSFEVLTQLVTPCCENHGIVRAYNAKTGEDIWEYHTTKDAAMNGNRRGPSGAPVWSTVTIDDKRNAVYFGTGQNYSRPASNTSDAIIALDVMSGTEKWVFQARKNDVWNAYTLAVFTGKDFDFGGSPILLEDGSAILAGDKGSVVYSIDPDNGKLNWKQKLGAGGTLGGIHWNMAVDEHHVYAGVSDVISDKQNTDLRVPENANPGVYALDLKNGEIVWEKHPTHRVNGQDVASLYSASVSVANDVLFASSLDGIINAFNTKTGETLWTFDTAISVEGVNGIAGNGGTIDSVGAIVAGSQVLINSGYNKFGGTNQYQAGPGNALFVLKLNE